MSLGGADAAFIQSRSRPPNREILIGVAEQIRPLLPDVVFVGGQIAELLVTDPAATRIRPTKEIVDDLKQMPKSLRDYVAALAEEFLAHDQAAYAVTGALPDAVQLPGLIDNVMARFRKLAAIGE